MSACKKITIIAISLALLFSLIEAGPMSFLNRAFRNGREIRAPFKNSEIMVARGFGKRDVTNDRTDNGKTELIIDEQESIPIEWVVKELSTNPGLARAILHKFVDVNHDGTISAVELIGSSDDSNSVNLHNNEGVY